MQKSLWIKIAVFGLCIAIIFVGWAFDNAWAKKYDFELVFISNETPYATQEDVVDFTVRVTKDGKPCSNHEISASCSRGQLNVMLVRTDENGYADFSYAPYNENRYVKAEEVFFEIADLSNSIFVEVHAQLEFSIKLRSIKEKV